MSSLEKYVEKVKKETEGFSSIEKLRYIYWDLGSKFAFDLDFSFGNSKTRKQIYDHSRSEDDLNRCLENNTAICKSIAYIFSYVMKELGVNIESVIDEEDFRKCPHIYNVLITEDGRKYRFDLQEDMRNIKAQLRTQYFGIPIEGVEQELISRTELDQIDKKQGHISEKSYYTDEYLELIKMHLPMFKDFGQKVQFVLENSEAYTSPEMGYADRKWRMEDLIGNENKDGLLFSKEEKYKINMIDCYRENDGKKHYELCIVVNVKGGKDIYLFSDETNSFRKMTLEEFAKQIENGLINLQGIQGLKQVLKNIARILFYIVILFIAQASNVFAADDPLAVVNNLSNFIFGLIRAVGMIILGFGVVQVGMSLKSHDPSQRANGIMTLAGGIVITFAKEILNIITGG